MLHNYPERLSSQDILAWMHTREERPWNRETSITAQQLAAELHQFKVSPRLQRVGNRVARGYRLEDVQAAHKKFLASEDSRVAQPPSAVHQNDCVARDGVEVPSAVHQSATDQPAITADFVAHAPATSNAAKANNSTPARAPHKAGSSSCFTTASGCNSSTVAATNRFHPTTSGPPLSTSPVFLCEKSWPCRC